MLSLFAKHRGLEIRNSTTKTGAPPAGWGLRRRNPKQIRIFKIQMTETPRIFIRYSRFEHLKIRILDLFRASCFGFLISHFCFRISNPTSSPCGLKQPQSFPLETPFLGFNGSNRHIQVFLSRLSFFDYCIFRSRTIDFLSSRQEFSSVKLPVDVFQD